MSNPIGPILDDCRVMIQGITGREASMVAGQMLRYGTKVVAGVSPGKGGQKAESVPVFDSVREAVDQYQPNASIIYVPPAFVRDAALEVIDSGIPLVVIITERVPVRDTIEFVTGARAKGVHIVGPNTVGLIDPARGVKLGPIGGDRPSRVFIPGHATVISRSGGMSTETAWMLRREGIGTRLTVGIGGDPVIGSTSKEMIEMLKDDPETHAVVLFCEPGGGMEHEVADFMGSGGFKKPVIAYVAGVFTESLPRGIKFGHAGAIVSDRSSLPSEKKRALKASGVAVAERFADVPRLVKELTRG